MQLNGNGIPADKFNYHERIQFLYSRPEYFLTLSNGEPRHDYYDSAIDPDGTKRNPFEEQSLWNDNNSELIALINRQNHLNSVLDFGCGPGYLLSAIKAKKKFGVELSEKARSKPAGNFKIFKSLDEIPENLTFDTVIINHVLEHLSKPVEVLNQLVKTMLSGGRLILGIPNFHCAMSSRFKEKYRMLNEPTHISLFTEYSIIRLLLDLGLRINEIQYPFFDSPYFTKENIDRILDNPKTVRSSPPFYGNFLLVVAEKL